MREPEEQALELEDPNPPRRDSTWYRESYQEPDPAHQQKPDPRQLELNL